jgi:hypothetical protein
VAEAMSIRDSTPAAAISLLCYLNLQIINKAHKIIAEAADLAASSLLSRSEISESRPLLC